MATSNTGEEQVHRPGTFKKGDARINRKGRPKSFDQLRALAQSIANEPAINSDTHLPILIDGHIATQAELIIRSMMKENPERFVEIAYGKVPMPVEMSGPDKKPIVVKAIDVRSLLTAISPRSMESGESSGEDESSGGREEMGEKHAGDES